MGEVCGKVSRPTESIALSQQDVGLGLGSQAVDALLPIYLSSEPRLASTPA
jgi:hypothetical protein